MTKPVIILGGGGHARVLISVLRQQAAAIVGIADPNLTPNREISGVLVLGPDAAIAGFSPHEVVLVNGIGNRASRRGPGLDIRGERFRHFKALGYVFAPVIHPSAVVATDSANLGEGVQIMAGAIVQTAAAIGENAIVNTGAIVDHDCIVGPHVHVAPGAVLCGEVRVGAGSHIGAGAVVIQDIDIGENVMIGAGAVVRASLGHGACVSGVPARAW